MNARHVAAVASIAWLVGAPLCAQAAPQRVILDTDPGTDDALAIVLALNSPEVSVDALTTVPGNVNSDQGLANALQILGLARRCDIPVARGATHPLNQLLTVATYWHGANGLADIELPASPCKADRRFGPDLIIDQIHSHPHEVVLIALGPLTNIALAVSKDPSIVGLVKDLVIMGGSLSGGNVTGAAEFNVYNDPEAAQIVFDAGWTVTMIGSDVGSRTLLTEKEVTALAAEAGPESRLVIAIARYIIAKSATFGTQGMAMYDPLAVAAVIDPSLVSLQSMRIDIETRGTLTRGETVANRMGTNEIHIVRGDHLEVDRFEPTKPNARVAMSADAARFLGLLIRHLRGR
jgi:purine nucleosidase